MTKSSTLFDVYLVKFKSSGRFCQTFEAFSIYMNFMSQNQIGLQKQPQNKSLYTLYVCMFSAPDLKIRNVPIPKKVSSNNDLTV